MARVDGVVVLDLETRDWEEPRGEWRAPRLAVAVAFHAASATYRTYFEQDPERLVADLQQADLVVGFAVRSFDYVVLERYGGPSVHELPTLDILEEVRKSLRRRVGLHHLALATLGRGKSADGWQAVRWWRQGWVDRVVEYCRRDVELTWELYRFGCENGYLRYRDAQGRLREVPVSWAGPGSGAGMPGKASGGPRRGSRA